MFLGGEILQIKTHLKGVIYASLAGIFWEWLELPLSIYFRIKHVSVYWMMGCKNEQLSALTFTGIETL